jgi:hypothetical protein
LPHQFKALYITLCCAERDSSDPSSGMSQAGNYADLDRVLSDNHDHRSRPGGSERSPYRRRGDSNEYINFQGVDLSHKQRQPVRIAVGVPINHFEVSAHDKAVLSKDPQYLIAPARRRYTGRRRAVAQETDTPTLLLCRFRRKRPYDRNARSTKQRYELTPI